jgi:hypothetical protein
MATLTDNLSGDDNDGDGGEPQSAGVVVANLAIDEQRLRRIFRSLAVTAALATLVVLLVSMGTIVWTFLHEFRTLAVDAQVELVAGPHAALAATAATPASAVAIAVPAASATSAPLPVLVPVVAPAPARLVVSLGGFTTAIAALVSAFVVAATVLAIALVRASFTLAARGDDPARPDRAPEDDVPVTLPTAEFVKAFGESLHTALKGVGGAAR